MGKSPTIKDLSNTDKEFSAFMEEMGKSVKEAAAGFMSEFQNSVKSFYADSNGEYTRMAAKEHEDYQVEAEFTMKNIAEVIEKIGKEVFGTPSGDAEKQETISALDSYAGMAVKVAVNFLSNALSALAWKESASFTHDIQHVSLGPGLTLHLLIVSRVYEGRGPIKSKKVLQNFILYQMNFSRKKAAAQADILYLQAQMNSLNGDSAAYHTIQKAWTALLASKEYLQEAANGPLHLLAANYQSILNELRASQKAAYEAIRELADCQAAADNMLHDHKAVLTQGEPVIAPNAKLIAYLKRHNES